MKSGRKSRRRRRRNWREISEDLWIEEIFSRLPTKIIGQIQCVCKTWNSLISSNRCIDSLHRLASSSTPPSSQTFLILHNPNYVFYLPQQDEHLKISTFPFQFQDPSPSNLNFEIVDVVNGLVCVSCSISSSFDSTLVWNPAIRRYVRLPMLNSSSSGVNLEISNDKFGFKLSIGIGFGYHNYDFKVVRVWTLSCSYIRCAIFSSAQGLWRESMTKVSVDGFIAPTGCFLNGTVHWLVLNPRGYYSLLMFDCGEEEFRTIELPTEIILFHLRNSTKEYKQLTQFFKYSGMLSVLLSSNKASLSELWVMKNHGVWTKLFNLSISPHFDNFCMVREDGDVFFKPTLKRLAAYNPNQWMRKLGVKRFYRPLNAHVYEASLFLMEGRGNSYANDEVVGIQLYHLQADTTRLSMWRCPPVNWIKLNVRGTFKGKGHPAGAGGVFVDHKGKFIRAFSLKIKGESAVKTLLKCLWKGLYLAHQIGIHSLIVELDKGKVVQCVTTSSSDLETELGYELIQQCKSLVEGRGWRVGICHAPRPLNKVADWLAKTGMKQDAEYVVFDDIPYEIEQLIASGV